jgi:hypothetical protein
MSGFIKDEDGIIWNLDHIVAFVPINPDGLFYNPIFARVPGIDYGVKFKVKEVARVVAARPALKPL